MEVVEYFSSENKESLKQQIARADWAGARFLLKLLNNIKDFDELLGNNGKLFMLMEGAKVVSFVTLTNQDCVRDLSMLPWLGFLYTYPDYRGNRYSETILNYAELAAKSEWYSVVYLATDHIGLYEKYGYTYMETRKDYWNEESRIYYKKL